MQSFLPPLASLVVFSLVAIGPECVAAAAFEESDGVVHIEAEQFTKQTNDDTRRWHRFSEKSQPKIDPDGDEPHLKGASGGGYVEVLPDTRRSHDDKLIRGENFTEDGGKMAVLTYKVRIINPGRYFIWVRAYSTTTEDNGVHFGLNGTWPASGARWQTTKKHGWHWDCRQRTKRVHTGVPMQLWLDFDKPGDHEIHMSMREDGTEVDQIALARDRNWRPADMKRQRTDTPIVEPRGKDGDGSVVVSGELKQWHNISLTLDGPFAHEHDTDPNPFTDYRMTVTFTHESGSPSHTVPGYFAADGNAAQTSADRGTKWRAHLSPDKPGKWTYRIRLFKGRHASVDTSKSVTPIKIFDGKTGKFEIKPTDKSGRDFRAHGRLEYVDKHYLRFAGSGKYFLKAGADAPETFLAYADFDGTEARKRGVPLKTWRPHTKDWKPGDPTWKDSKGKGMIGALNYLSGKGCNVFSFLPYNAGGDGDNVWPFVERDRKLHYDCSKLDQWGIVFDHATARGLYLHFKLQETEIDDNRKGHGRSGNVPTSLDGGRLGLERKLYCRELIARFGHLLALNWNLGEENTQSTEEQRAMANYIADLDAYDHHIVVHTFPPQHDKVYRPLLGNRSALTGVSLQNSNIYDTHRDTLKWVRESAEARKPWVVAFDESGNAAHGQPPDLGYRGFDGKDNDGKKVYTQHEVRKYTLWGTLMAGGAGVEYYFGYKLSENDLVCEDWRSRDQSWDYCRIALGFFHEHDVPFWEMKNANALVGNPKDDNSKYCLAKPGSVYAIYLPEGGTCELDLTGQTGEYLIQWYNPREGGELKRGSIGSIKGGGKVSIGNPPSGTKQDWVALVRGPQ